MNEGVRAIIGALPHQIEFAEHDERYCAIVGGFGSGKSFSIPLRTLNLLKRRKGRGKILILSPTYRMSQDIL